MFREAGAMDMLGIAIGVLGLIVALVTYYKTRSKEFMVRVHLAKMTVVVKTIEANAGWAVDHFRDIRQALDGEWSDDARRKASNAVHQGNGDAMAASQKAHELLRDIRALQLATFGKSDNLTSEGNLLTLADKDGSQTVQRDPGMAWKTGSVVLSTPASELPPTPRSSTPE
jgi:hypothetical protein